MSRKYVFNPFSNKLDAVNELEGGTDYEFPLTFNGPISRASNEVSFIPGAVMRRGKNGTQTTYTASADTDAARGAALEEAIAAHAAGDNIFVGPGGYDITTSLTLLAGASLVGLGRPLLYAAGLTNALIRLVHDDITVQGVDLVTDAVGFGEISATPVSVSGIVLRDVSHAPSAVSNTSGLQFTQVIGGGATEHLVGLSAYHSRFYGGSTLGYGVHMALASGSIVNLYNCDVYGATDGVLNKTTSGTSTGITNIYGGTYRAVLDAITSGGGTSNVINVYGATAFGEQADIFGDDGRVNVYWGNYRTEYIVGNGINQALVHNVMGSHNIIAGQLTLSDFGAAPDVGIARIGSTAIRASNASSGRIDLEVADEAYDATGWNGSFEVPTKNAVRDQIEVLQPRPVVIDIGNLGTSQTFDCSTASVFTGFLNADTTLTISNLAEGQRATLELYFAAAPRALVWVGIDLWGEGAEPALGPVDADEIMIVTLFNSGNHITAMYNLFS